MLHHSDDNHHHHQEHQMSWREYEYRRQKAYERERQRRALEEQGRQMELRRLQRAQQAERSCRQRAEYEKQQRSVYEASPRRRAVEQQQEEVRTRSTPKYTVVRGRDGWSCQVPVEEDERQHLRGINASTHAAQQRSLPHRVLRDSNTAVKQEENLEDVEATKLHRGRSQTKQRISHFGGERHGKRNKDQHRKKKITVIVEDVSDDDSDIEADPLNDYWRNRHPSAEESWMEPVSF